MVLTTRKLFQRILYALCLSLSLYLSSFFELFPPLGVTRRRPRLGCNYLTDFSRSKARTQRRKKCAEQILSLFQMFTDAWHATSFATITVKGDENLSCHDDHSSTTTTRTATTTCRVRLTGGGERANMAARRKSIKHVTFSGGGVSTRRSEPTFCVVFSPPFPQSALLAPTTTTPRNECRSTS